MKRGLFKKIILVCLVALVASSLSACSIVPSLSTTDEQTELIAEYSAGLLLKYNKGHALGLVPMEADDFNDEPEEEIPAPEEDAYVEENEQEEDAEIISTEPEGEPLNEIGDVTDAVTSSLSMAEALGIEGFDVSYTGNECVDIYPEESGEDMVFSMQASEGKTLMVLHFNLANTGEAASVCGITDNDIKARIIIDGGKRIPALATILLNDLLTYSDEVAGYGMVDTVIVFEVDEAIAASAQSISLVLVNGDGEQIYAL